MHASAVQPDSVYSVLLDAHTVAVPTPLKPIAQVTELTANAAMVSTSTALPISYPLTSAEVTHVSGMQPDRAYGAPFDAQAAADAMPL